MSWSRLQSASSGPHSTVASLAVAYASNLTAGTKLIAVVTIANGNANQTTTCTGVSDGNGNNFTQLADASVTTNASGNYTNNVYLFAMDTPAGDAGTKPTITAALSNSAGYGAILIQEVSGLLAGNTSAMLDGSVAVSSGNGATNSFTAAPASYSSTAANEYLVDIYGDDGNSTWTAPAGYTADANSLNANGIYASLAIGYKNSGNGSESGSWSVTQPGTFKNWGVVLVAFKLAGGTSHNRTAALTVTPSFSAARTRGKFRTGSLTVTPSFRAVPSGGAVVQVGSWWGLDTVFKQNRQEFEAFISRPPMACPNDGEPLINAPATMAGSGCQLYCKYDGWQYPRDWIAPQRP